MQRIISLSKAMSTMVRYLPGALGLPAVTTVHNVMRMDTFLTPTIPAISQVCNFKVKGRVKRRCKSCYFVVRDERLYVICPKFPRHKQMAMKPKPHNTWILTHASQSPIRPW